MRLSKAMNEPYAIAMAKRISEKQKVYPLEEIDKKERLITAIGGIAAALGVVAAIAVVLGWYPDENTRTLLVVLCIAGLGVFVSAMMGLVVLLKEYKWAITVEKIALQEEEIGEELDDLDKKFVFTNSGDVLEPGFLDSSNLTVSEVLAGADSVFEEQLLAAHDAGIEDLSSGSDTPEDLKPLLEKYEELKKTVAAIESGKDLQAITDPSVLPLALVYSSGVKENIRRVKQQKTYRKRRQVKIGNTNVVLHASVPVAKDKYGRKYSYKSAVILTQDKKTNHAKELGRVAAKNSQKTHELRKN